MPRTSRNAILGVAKAIRFQGETVTLLTPTLTPDTTRATPLYPTDYKAMPNLSAYKKTVIYAKVIHLPRETVTYDEGGRETNRKVRIEAPIGVQNQMHSAYAIQIQDGTILRKVKEQISDLRDMYIIEAEGELNMVM